MAADLQFTITFDSNGEPVIKNITRSVDAAKAGVDRLGPAMDKADQSVKTVAKSGLAAAASIADIGPWGHIAAQALTAMAVASGPVAVAFGVVAGAIAFVNSRVEAARENFRSLAEREMKDLQREGAELKLDQAFRSQITVLQSLDPELETIRQKYEQVGIAAERSGAGAETLGRIARVAQLEQNKILDARQETAGKIQQQIQNEISSRQLQIAAIGRTGQAVDALALAEKLAALDARALAGEHGALIQQLAQTETAAFKLKTAFDQITTGRAAIAQFQQQFGVQFDFDKKLAGQTLADNFAAVFKDPRAQATIGAAFKSFSEQALALGLPDIPELMVKSLGSMNFERLMAEIKTKVIREETVEIPVDVRVRNVFGGSDVVGQDTLTQTKPVFGQEIVDQLNATRQAGQQWGDALGEEFVEAEIGAGRVGQAVGAVEKRFQDLTAIAARRLAIDVDASRAQADSDRLRTTILSIPERKTVVIDVVVNGGELLSQLQRQVEQTTGRVLDFQVLN